MFRETFRSEVTLERPSEVRVTYLNGPFRYLNNTWKFLPHPAGCEVDFYVDFEFRSALLQAAIGLVFNEAVQLMVLAQIAQRNMEMFKAAAAADGGFKQARARQAEVQSVSGPSTETPVAIPGVRPLGGVVAAAVDNINAPLPSTTSTSRTKSSAADPSFPTTQATVVIIISRP
jgi:hypothetical protein